MDPSDITYIMNIVDTKFREHEERKPHIRGQQMCGFADKRIREHEERMHGGAGDKSWPTVPGTRFRSGYASGIRRRKEAQRKNPSPS